MGYASAIATLLFLMMIGTNKLIQFVLNRVGELTAMTMKLYKKKFPALLAEIS